MCQPGERVSTRASSRLENQRLRVNLALYSTDHHVTIVARTFDALLGEACWGVEWESHLGLKLSFGTPRLSFIEPRDSNARTERVRRLATYRIATVRGRWWLWALCARWRVTLRDAPPVTASSSQRRRRESLQLLDGQRLIEASVEPRNGATALRFDLGGLLEFRGSFCDDGDMWTLYKPGGYFLSVRSDGCFSHHRGSEADRWRPLSEISTCRITSRCSRRRS